MRPRGKAIAIIPARAGSQRIPGKNLRSFAGKPLIDWTIDVAFASDCFDQVLVTTDCEITRARAQSLGVQAPWLRPALLATSTASMASVVSHALESLPGFDWAVLLQPTSPLRAAEDVRRAFFLAAETGRCVSVHQEPQSASALYHRALGGKLSPVADSGDPIYRLNGAVYAFSVPEFMLDPVFVSSSTRLYPMPFERSVDLDTEWDWRLAEWLRGWGA